MGMSLDIRAKALDARYNLPRPADQQHLSSYRALLVLMQTGAQAGVLTAFAFTSLLGLAFILWCLAAVFPFLIVLLACSAVAAVIGFFLFIDVSALLIDYTRLRQRETFGAARRATLADLKAHNLAVRKGIPPQIEPEFDTTPVIEIGNFGAFHWLAFTLKRMSGHTAVFAPPGQGKTASIFVPVVRQWAPYGAAFVLDVKGEIYRFTANYYEKVFRIDFENPYHSDRLPLLADCAGNPELAGEMCALMVGIHTNSEHKGDPFWKPAAIALGKCLFLHLAALCENATPAHVEQFLGSHPRDHTVFDAEGKHVKVDLLDESLSASPDERVRHNWTIFKGYDRKLQGGVIATLMTSLDQFTLPNAQTVFSTPSKLDRLRGVKTIDLKRLRDRGSAIYVVIGEGKAKQYANVLSTVFGAASFSLNDTAELAGAVPCLIAMEEAGNVFHHDLYEDVGVGRGRGKYYLLNYQNKSQIESQYGALRAAGILQSINNKIFLPGIQAETAKWAVELFGQTTVLQHSSTDAVHNALDNDRVTETGVPLITTTALTEMLEYHQAVARVTGGCPTIFFGLLKDPTKEDSAITHPPQYVIEPLRSFVDSRRGASLPVTLPHYSNGGVSPLEVVFADDGSGGSPEVVNPPSVTSDQATGDGQSPKDLSKDRQPETRPRPGSDVASDHDPYSKTTGGKNNNYLND